MPRLVAAVVQPGALSDMHQPEVSIDEQLLLRPWDEVDVPAVVAAYADRDIQAWNLSSMNDAEAQEWIRSWAATWEAETDAGHCRKVGPFGRRSNRAEAHSFV
jgi:RimJ/RimL family protein N-acetyltransferase